MRLLDLIVVRDVARWLRAAGNAIEGILVATRRERHLRFHLFAAFCILLFCFVVGLDKTEFVIILLTVLLVIVTEMVNTALESATDVLSRAQNFRIKIAKDIAAGAVLVAAAGALVIGYLILTPYVLDILTGEFRVARHQPENVAVLALIIVVLLVVFLKTLFLKEDNIRGGFPSGHTAIAFSLLVSAVHLLENLYLLAMLLFLALVVSGYRLSLRHHRVGDVLGGAVVGGGVTWGLYLVFG